MNRATVVFALGLAACGPVPAVEYGEEVFRDPGFADSQYNAFACSTCHSVEPAVPKEGPRVGYTLYDSAFREAWWGGYTTRLIDAVSFCYVYFMRGEPLDPEDPRGRALYEYLVSLSPGAPAPARPFTVVENLATVARGSQSRGEEVWRGSCQGCHGEPHSGDGRIADRLPIVPEASTEFAEQFDFDPALVVTEKVRHGQFFGVGGNMPLFTVEAMSDADLGALLRFLDL